MHIERYKCQFIISSKNVLNLMRCKMPNTKRILKQISKLWIKEYVSHVILFYENSRAILSVSSSYVSLKNSAYCNRNHLCSKEFQYISIEANNWRENVFIFELHLHRFSHCRSSRMKTIVSVSVIFALSTKCATLISNLHG